jgi:protein-disulfide isomerase
MKMKLCALALLAMWPAMAALSDVDPQKTAGKPSAAVTIEVFSDFECPACKVFHDNTLPQLQRDFVATGKVFLVFREYPLPMHAHSREAANYAVAAARLSLYQAVADAMFRDQAAWSANGKVWDAVASVLTPAQQKKVKAGADDPSVLGEIMREVSIGRAVPIQSTPTLVITHGATRYPVSGTINYEFLKGLLDGLLK